MNPILRGILILSGIIPWATTLSGSPTMIFIKNPGGNAGIWINGVYQGLSPGGKVCYIPREGFVTLDSGIQPDGTNKVQHAHAGWHSDGDLVFEATGNGSKGPLYCKQIIPASYEVAYVSLWGNNLPVREDEEFAVKLVNAGPPIGLHSVSNPGGWFNKFKGSGWTFSISNDGGDLAGQLDSAKTSLLLKAKKPQADTAWFEDGKVQLSAKLDGNQLTLTQGSTKIDLTREGAPGVLAAAVGPALSREEIKDAKLGTLYDAGGAGISELFFDPPPPQGARLRIYYDFYSVPDRITVTFSGPNGIKKVFDSGMTGGSRTLELPQFDAQTLRVVIEGGSDGTAWQFKLEAY